MQIKYKIGICKGCGDEKVIVHKSKCLCTLCNEREKKKRYAKNTIQRRRSKGIGRDKDREFYERIWNEREHVCFETGQRLGNGYNVSCFHHVLAKRNFPQFRYSDWNIVILDPDIHAMVEANINKCPRVKQYTEELKQKYNEGSI